MGEQLRNTEMQAAGETDEAAWKRLSTELDTDSEDEATVRARKEKKRAAILDEESKEARLEPDPKSRTKFGNIKVG